MAERAHPEDPGFQEGSPYRANLFKRYAFANKFTKGKTVLDVPCGVGWGTSLLKGEYIIGIDIDAGAVAYGKKHYPGIDFLVGNMANIPLKDNSVDVVVCLEGFEHVSKDTGTQFLAEAVRVIKENGLLVMTVPVILPGGKHSRNPYHLHETALSDLKKIVAHKFYTQSLEIVKGPDGPVVYFVGSPKDKTNMTKFSHEESSIKYPKKNRSNILLTTSAAPSQSPFSTGEKRPPIGIGFLISSLRNAGHKVFFIDNYLRPSNFLETDYLQENEIDYVGIYANTICFRDTLRMVHKLEHLRQMHRWNGKIIIGGPHTTVACHTIPDFVNYIVQGEGEQAIVDIVDGNVAQRIVSYPRIENLDVLPMPAWDYFAKLPYDWNVKFFQDKPVFTMNTSRGCPFRCGFCSVCSIWGKRYTYFSAERIVSDIEHLVRHYGAKGIYFREDNFTLNKERLRKFCNLLLEKGIKIPWACESRVSNLSRDLIELMARAGAKGFYFGVESGSQRILDFLQKDITVEQIREVFQWCHEFNVKTAASVIVGIPGETYSDSRRTSELLKQIKPDVVWNNVFVGIPNSKLYCFALDNRLYEYIDDRGLVYLQGHNDRVQRYYGNGLNACIPDDEKNKDMTRKPKISVLISVYNCEKYIEQALKSIYSQTYHDFEVVVVDDGSTDRTSDILVNMKDSRTFIYRNPENLGLTKSLNIGLKLCRGQYIARMDADDISLPRRFEKQVEFLEKNSDYALFGSSYYHISEDGKIASLTKVLTGNLEIRQGLKKQNWFGHGTVMIRRDCFVSLGGYDEKYKFAQDYDLWLKVAEKYKVGNIDEPLYCWRTTPLCISNTKKEEQKYYKNLAISKAQNRIKTKNLAMKGSIKSGKVSEKESTPMVSVIVPTYNRHALLVKTLKSILNQTNQNFEIIVVNDSGVDVEDIIADLNERKNITYVVHASNRGLAAARNTGIKAARGKYIAYLDDDDIYYPDHLEKLCTFLESTDYKVGYTNAYRAHQKKVNGKYIVAEKTIPYSFDVDHDQLLVRNLVPVLCVMHEKSCIEEVGQFDETLTTHEDWDLWIRMSKKFKFLHINKVTAEVTWRTDGSTITSGKRADFLRTPEIIYSKYKEYTINKPHVIEHQRRRLQNLKQRYRQTFLRPVQDEILPAESKLQKLNFAIKTCTRTRHHTGWGDTNVANSLAKAIRKLGHKCEVHFQDEWNQPDTDVDIVIHIKGKFQYTPKPHNFNILWIISHPELHTIGEINRFDTVFCASKLYFENPRSIVEVPFFYLPQATDEDLFKPLNYESPKDIDILFVGNNYYKGKRRKIIQDVLDTGKKYNLYVVGKSWHRLLNQEYYKAEYVDWDKLPELYSRAKIVLNDHHETMKQFGFINNRTFDLAALKAFQISDYVKGMEEFGIVTYQTPADLREKLDYFLQNEKERGRIANLNYERCKNFTFINIARKLVAVVKKLFDEKSLRKTKDNMMLPSVSKPGETAPAVSLSRLRPKVSVITSCYNSEKFLPECLDSIRNQTLQEWELFLIDDCSTDGTKSVIEKYARMDKRIKPYYFQYNKGPYVRRNFAIERACSDFIVIHDADDIMCTNKLEVLYNEIAKDERLGIVGSFYWKFLEEFKGTKYAEKVEFSITHGEIIAKAHENVNFCCHGSAIIRRSLFNEIGLYDENPFGSDSFWLAKVVEYVSHGGNVRLMNIPEFLMLRRMHLASQTGFFPYFDPRSRRAKLREYRKIKINQFRERLYRNPDADLKEELKNCKCSDYIEKYGHLFERWESEPLGDNSFYRPMGTAVESFNSLRYVTCIIHLDGIEKIKCDITKRFKNYDLLRAMAYLAIGRRDQSLRYINNEIQNHDNSAAKKFRSDYFENQLKTDLQSWCLENGRLYELRIIDLEKKSGIDRQRETVSDRRYLPQAAPSHAKAGASAPTSDRPQADLDSNCGRAGPLVSVIMPAYNAAEYITEAIKSVLNQTYKDYELVVINDGSTDRTEDIVLGFKDEKIKYFRQENIGAWGARNRAIKESKGIFIINLDTDDMMTPDFIAKHLHEFEKHPEADLIYCDDYLIEQDGKPIRVIKRREYTNRKFLIRDLFRCGFPIVPFRTCIRKTVFDKIGFFDEDLVIGGDYDMMRRFVKNDLKIHHLDGALYLRRMTSNSLSRTFNAQKAKCLFEVVKRYTETFTYEELFPDVAWDEIAPQIKQLHAKCLAAGTYLAIGQDYVKTKAVEYSRTAFDKACSELNDCVKMNPENQELRQLLQKSELIRARYTEAPQQVVSK